MSHEHRTRLTAGRVAGRPRLVLLAVAAPHLAMLSACGQMPAGAVGQIEQADGLVRSGQYDVAARLCTRVITDYPAHADTAEALYLRGMCFLYQGRVGPARSDFQAGLRLAKRPDLVSLLYAQLGNIDFSAEAWSSAAEQYRRAMPNLPRRAPSDRVLYQYAVALQRAGRFDEARPVFTRLLGEHAGSRYAEPARSKRAWSLDYFMIQCGSYSDIGRANEAASELRRRGIEALAIPGASGGSRLTAVRAGKYATYTAAAEDLGRIRAAVPDAFVLP